MVTFARKIWGHFYQKYVFFRLKKGEGLVFQSGENFVLFNMLSLDFILIFGLNFFIGLGCYFAWASPLTESCFLRDGTPHGWWDFSWMEEQARCMIRGDTSWQIALYIFWVLFLCERVWDIFCSWFTFFNTLFIFNQFVWFLSIMKNILS